MDLVYPVDICRKIDRQWQRRAAAARQRPRPTRRAADDRVCPLCHTHPDELIELRQGARIVDVADPA
jgi:hypothetical protein